MSKGFRRRERYYGRLRADRFRQAASLENAAHVERSRMSVLGRERRIRDYNLP